MATSEKLFTVKGIKRDIVETILRRALQLVHKRWRFGACARDEDGMGVDDISRNAYYFGTCGALRRACLDLRRSDEEYYAIRYAVEDYYEKPGAPYVSICGLSDALDSCEKATEFYWKLLDDLE